MSAPILEARGVSKRYKRPKGESVALERVDMSLGLGESIGIAGPSGAGKSTLARILCGMEAPTEGRISLEGRDIKMDKSLRRRIQMIWQDPTASLNPYMTAAQLISEPMQVFFKTPRAKLRQKVLELSHMTGLDEGLLGRKPHELSGGQCARVAAARALAADPVVLICDESFSSLDVPSQDGFMDVLEGMIERRRISLIIISHDLFPIKRLCPRTCIIHGGRIVEAGNTTDVLSNPQDPWTREMVSSIFPWPFQVPPAQEAGNDPVSPISRLSMRKSFRYTCS
jgi:ABC-type glutathione transport system ATPase component